MLLSVVKLSSQNVTWNGQYAYQSLKNWEDNDSRSMYGFIEHKTLQKSSMTTCPISPKASKREWILQVLLYLRMDWVDPKAEACLKALREQLKKMIMLNNLTGNQTKITLHKQFLFKVLRKKNREVKMGLKKWTKKNSKSLLLRRIRQRIPMSSLLGEWITSVTSKQ